MWADQVVFFESRWKEMGKGMLSQKMRMILDAVSWLYYLVNLRSDTSRNWVLKKKEADANRMISIKFSTIMQYVLSLIDISDATREPWHFIRTICHFYPKLRRLIRQNCIYYHALRPI